MIYHIDRPKGVHYMAMEYAAGKALDQSIGTAKDDDEENRKAIV